MSNAGKITEPKVIRGEPPRAPKAGMRRGPFPWERHREVAMALPPTRIPGTNELRGGWVLCGEAKRRGDGPKTRRKQIISLQRSLKAHLDRRFPLERFQLSVITVEGTDCDVELYMRFLGKLTPEEDAADRARKRANYVRMLERRREVKAERALKNRAQGGPSA